MVSVRSHPSERAPERLRCSRASSLPWYATVRCEGRSLSSRALCESIASDTAAIVSGQMHLRSSSSSILALTLLAGLANGACGDSSLAPAAISCPESVAASCATSTVEECLPTWSAVLAGKSCSTDGYPDSTYICGSYEVHRIQYVDTYSLSFYDPASGALLAVVGGNGPSESCEGGPGAFAVPICSNPKITFGTCPDAGADSGP